MPLTPFIFSGEQKKKKTVVSAGFFFVFLASVLLSPLVSKADENHADKGHRSEILVGSEFDYAPYALVTNDGKADGFTVDLMKAVCEVMGIKVEFKVGPWNEVRGALETGDVEALPLVSYSAEREKVFDFTTPHTVSYAAIFKRKDSPNIDSIDELRGKSIITMRSDATHDWLLENQFSENYVLTKTMTEALQLLASGKHDYALAPRLVGLLTAKKLKLSNLDVTGPRIDVYGRGYGFAVKEGDFALLAQLNQGLAIVRETGRYDELYEKWFGIVDPKGLSDEDIQKYVTWAIGAFLTFMGISLAWSLSLRRKVEHRTLSLKEEISERKKAEKALFAHHQSLIRLQGLTSSTDMSFDEKAQALLELGTEIFNMPLGIISHIQNQTYTAQYIFGPEWAPKPNSAFELGNTYCFHTLNANAPTAFDNAGKSKISDHPCYLNFGLESYIGVKIEVNGELYGTLNFSNPEVHPTKFSNAEFVLIQLLADWVGSELSRQHNERVIIQAKLDAENANRSKSEFLSSMSHELRTPLNSILGFAQILELDETSPLSAKHKDEAHQIIKGGEHLLDLINDVLNLAAIEAGQLELDITTVKVQKILNDCLHMIEGTTFKLEVTVKADSFANTIVMADPIRLKQVFFNLLSNAVKYNRKGGTVHITNTITEDGLQRISIKDTGIGIAKEKQSDMFKPFTRLGAENSNIEGSGIGLTITEHLLEAMGGRVGFESTENIGSTFWIDLPMATSEQVEAMKIFRTEQFGETLNTADNAVGKVLYIEDNQANVDLMETILSTIDGLKFETTDTAELGVPLAIKSQPNLILMDINLPGMSGIEAFLQLRKHEETKDIPVVAISAAAMPQEVQDAMDAGFLAYMTKPFNVPELLNTIADVLSNKK